MRSLALDDLRGRVESAKTLNNTGRPADAALVFKGVCAELGASEDRSSAALELHARALLGLSSSSLEVAGDATAALDLLATAEQLAEAADAQHLLVAIRGQRGLLLLRRGDTGAALAQLDQAVAQLDRSEPADQITILINRGALNLELGRLKPARADLAGAVELALREGDRTSAHMARHNLAYVDFLSGDIPLALEGMDRAAALGAVGDSAIPLLDKARVLREAGLVSDADATLAEAAELFESGGLWQDLAETELVRAECALVEGDLARARRLAESARARFAGRHNQLWCRKAELLVLTVERGAVRNESGAPDSASLDDIRRRAEELVAVCLAEGRTEVGRAASLLVADCRLATGHPLDADVALQIHPGDPVTTRLQLLELRARRALVDGDTSAAGRYIRRGLDVLTDAQSRFGSLDLRTASAVHGISLARLDLDRAVRSGRPAAVLESVERFRAVSIDLAAVQPPSDPETADLLAELRQNAEARQAVLGDPSSADGASNLRQEAARIEARIRARAWAIAGSEEGTHRRTTAADVVRAGREDAVTFVSYATHAGRWIGMTASAAGTRMHELAPVDSVEQVVRRVRADLDAASMTALPKPMRDVVTRSLDAGLRKLDELLVKPLGVAGSSLVVSPSGLLAVLPWNLLPSRRGLPVVVVPGAAAWLRARQPTRSGLGEVAVVAGPGLLQAEDEASRVQRIWPGSNLLVGRRATVTSVAEALSEASVVHIAAHGTHQQESPLFSSLRLADGPMYAYELDASRGMAECVVLSACEAGLATVRPGDEGLGLTSALLHLGARSVLAGVARVRDDVAADVMERVHQQLSAGEDSATALAVAQLECAEAEAPAPFVVFGGAWSAAREVVA